MACDVWALKRRNREANSPWNANATTRPTSIARTSLRWSQAYYTVCSVLESLPSPRSRALQPSGGSRCAFNQGPETPSSASSRALMTYVLFLAHHSPRSIGWIISSTTWLKLTTTTYLHEPQTYSGQTRLPIHNPALHDHLAPPKSG